MQRLFESAYAQSFVGWCWISLAGNVAATGLSILACWVIARLFVGNRIFEHPQPLTSMDLLLSFGAVCFNTLIAIVGWVFWHQGWIVILHTSLGRALWDTILLIGIMDFVMYAFHRLAHHPLIYQIVHSSHHVHESTNPLSLFVLNPFEVLGFGSLLIAALMMHPFSAGAVLAYLTFNLVFGTMGHLGVEPLPACWRRYAPFRFVGTSTFHGQHHGDRRHNFGFYTTLWDRLFHTLDPEYDARFLAGRLEAERSTLASS